MTEKFAQKYKQKGKGRKMKISPKKKKKKRTIKFTQKIERASKHTQSTCEEASYLLLLKEFLLLMSTLMNFPKHP